MLVCGSLLGSILNVHTTAEKLGPSRDTVGISICLLKLKALLVNITLKESYTKNKMGGHPERHITDPRNTTMEETSRRQMNGGVF
jgi:hypothetical protein